ncbi:hypothetical protein ABZ689_32725, partial [Streptomyces sp. NPDC006874]|uniref:hypothetical protein n=1 Tax=Streptomyces sp. NPDC006874 TaxID=3157189 RepID=UPI0033D46607
MFFTVTTVGRNGSRRPPDAAGRRPESIGRGTGPGGRGYRQVRPAPSRVSGTTLLPGTALVELALSAGHELGCGHVTE